MNRQLSQLFGAYLHQDFDVVHGSVEAAIRAYRDESGPRERAAALAEIDALLAESATDDTLFRQLRGIGLRLDPRDGDQTATSWLRRVRAIVSYAT